MSESGQHFVYVRGPGAPDEKHVWTGYAENAIDALYLAALALEEAGDD